MLRFQHCQRGCSHVFYTKATHHQYLWITEHSHISILHASGAKRRRSFTERACIRSSLRRMVSPGERDPRKPVRCGAAGFKERSWNGAESRKGMDSRITSFVAYTIILTQCMHGGRRDQQAHGCDDKCPRPCICNDKVRGTAPERTAAWWGNTKS